MITSFSSEKIKLLIAQSKSAEPYSDEEMCVLDGPFKDGNKLLATLAKSTLNKYFALHPEDSIGNYND
ncbi:MAG: hypothetical protein IJC04_07755 [Oscillospiraceae bacterium]|nr:hypothetical protein [Oscillospiraceae bacterium]